MKEVKTGKIIYDTGQVPDELYLIMKGAVEAVCQGGGYQLRAGDVIGICEVGSDTTYLKYTAKEDVTLLPYPGSITLLKVLFEKNGEAIRYFLTSLFRQMSEAIRRYDLLKIECGNTVQYLKTCYEEYCKICEKKNVSAGELPNYEELRELVLEEEKPAWLGGYYSTLEQMLAVWDYNNTDYDFICGFLMKGGEDLRRILVQCNEMQEYDEEICRFFMDAGGLDLFGLYTGLYLEEVEENGASQETGAILKLKINEIRTFIQKKNLISPVVYQKRMEGFVKSVMELEKKRTDKSSDEPEDKAQLEAIAGSLEQILKYAECDGETEANFRKSLLAYKKLENKSGTDDEARKLRREISSLFYKIYIAAFQVSVRETEVPPVIQMFLNFGYVDEELAGIKNALYLYQIVQKLPTAPEKGIYSAYQWLMAIYTGEKEPGRNEFDLDYPGYLREQKRMGEITQEQEMALINNNGAKVMYELEHVFPSVNKITFGRPSTFCPVFSKHHVLKPLDTILVTAEKLTETLDEIRRIDYGAFFRETMYSEPDKGIPREMIQVEILPDIILMPNVGTRGIMWQEIEGKKRTTPARMMCSVFEQEDLSQTFIRLAAEFRWEMCKRIQGGRWNDMSEPSLTSEYCDYVQFYRKNKDLSSDAKEKVKIQLGKAKNSFKEMFIMDYIMWIQYESSGSPRLNKVARGILFTYCPFSKEIRYRLAANPLFKEYTDRHAIRAAQKIHHVEGVCQKLKNSGKEIPEEIENFKNFLEA